jgi:hypothetical protein
MQDLRDILLEVEDLGYETGIGGRDLNYGIIISRPQNFESEMKSIRYADLKDCLLRLKDYLGDKYIGCEIYDMNKNKDRWVKFPLTDDVFGPYLYDWSKVGAMSIEFKRL